MKRYLKILSLLSLITLSFNGWGQLLQWNTFGNTGTETTEPSVANDANISAANLTQGTITPGANANRFGGSAWSTSTLAAAVTGNDYIQFIVTPNAGYSFTPTSFVFSWQSSATGPTSVTLRSSADGYTSDLGTTTVNATLTSYTFTISGLTALSSATTFRLYGYGASAGTGTGGLDCSVTGVNVQLSGITAAISSNDATSKVEVPASQISAGDIASTATASGSSVSVFSFKVRDLGTSDGLVTKVTQVKIKKSSGTADWTDHIAGATLWNGATQITTGAVTITDADITFPITVGNLNIANNSNADITLKIWLNTTNIVDNSTMTFTVSQTAHGFTADATGSLFASDFGAAITGNTMTVRVTATKLLFVQQPSNTIVNVAMVPNPTVKATDANNNTDLDYSTAVSVTSTGTLTGTPVSGTWASNIATFASLTHTVIGTGLTLTATSGSLTSAISNAFDIVSAPSVFISELAAYGLTSGTFNNEYIELTNTGSSSLSLNGWQLLYYESGALEKTITFGATNSIPANDAFVVAVRTSYTAALIPDYVPATSFSMNNSSFYVVLKDNTSSIIDQAGTSTTGFTTDKNYEFIDCGTDNEPVVSWDDLGITNGTPGVVNCACTPPATQATNISITVLSSTSAQVNWTTGSGDRVIVVAREGSAVNADPTNGTAYSDNNSWMGGGSDQIGTGNYVVYEGTGTTVTVTGLTANMTYYFAIYEYNSADNCYNKIELTGSVNLCTNVTIPYSQGFNSATIPACWNEVVVANPGSMGTGISYVATSTTPTATPSEGTQFVKFNSYNADDGTEIRLVSPPITTTALSSINLDFDWFESPEYATYLTEGVTVQYSLNGGTSWTNIQFYQRYNSVNGWKAKTLALPSAINNQASVLIGFLFHSQYGNNCDLDDVYIYTCTEPTVNPITLSFANITSSTMDLTIGTIGNGSKRIIVAREGAAVSFTPSDLTTYDANSVFSDATDLGSGNKVIFNGNGSTVSLSGLNGSTTYYFKVFEYNCVTGYENYYTGGTILNGNATTLLSPVTNLQVTCQTNTTAEITWTAPLGSYTGVIIGIRNDANPCHAISNDASGYTANTIFASGTQYGSTTPYSFVVYKGTGTSVTVTGLTAGQTYQIKAYAYKNETGSVWSATQPTTAITSLGTVNVAGAFVLTDNAQLQLQWSNPPSSCFDEVMIVGTTGGTPITTVPTGDGSAYIGNLAFGSGTSYSTGFVVYKGTFSPQTVTGLTNGTQYCFTWFVRNGTTWSSGISACGTPAAITMMEPGDLAIVAVNTQATSSGSADEICYFAFKDITEGTSIDFTDNGWERLFADKWASSEGTIRMTRTSGGTITAGKVICFQGMGSSQSGFHVFTCGVADDANWTITSLNNAGALSGSYDLNVDDQIWIMQGGAWDNTGSLSAHNATYSGNVLYGWTATGWKPAPGYDDTKGSTLYPETECFNTNVAVAANHSKVKYIGDITTTSQFNWLGRINDNANWIGYVDNSAYYAGRDYTGACFEFISNAAISGVAGVWTGNANEDWFNCGNWQNLRIPNGSANVSASGAVGNHIAIDDGIPSMPEAECNDLTIAASATVGGVPIQLKVNNVNSVLNIYRNMENNQTILHTNGTIHYKGNFVNADTYTHNTAGTAIFDGSGAQTLTGTATFFNMQMNNSSSGLTINNDITINNIFTLTDGLINTGANKVVVENNATIAITGHSINSYINGNLRRKVAATGSYDLPIGTITNYEWANINLTTSTVTYLDAKFTSPHSGTILPTTPYLTIDGSNLTELLNFGFWTISPVAGTSTNYDVTLTSRGHTNGGSLATQHTIVKRTDAGNPWNSYEANHDNATQSGTGSSPITAKLTLMNGFSDFAIARSSVVLPLPIELIFFDAKLQLDDVLLEWNTATEINNDYFEVERSSNGIDFYSIGVISGVGNSSLVNSYSFIDYEPLNGLSFYRLRQVDYNGSFFYSNIESVIKNNKSELTVYNIYNPNFAASLLINNPSKSELYLRITDMSGKIIYSKKLESDNDKFMIEIDKGNISSGIYNLNIYNNNESVTRKIVIF